MFKFEQKRKNSNALFRKTISSTFALFDLPAPWSSAVRGRSDFKELVAQDSDNL